jgi:hypothetical protein
MRLMNGSFTFNIIFDGHAPVVLHVCAYVAVPIQIAAKVNYEIQP